MKIPPCELDFCIIDYKVYFIKILILQAFSPFSVLFCATKRLHTAMQYYSWDNPLQQIKTILHFLLMNTMFLLYIFSHCHKITLNQHNLRFEKENDILKFSLSYFAGDRCLFHSKYNLLLIISIFFIWTF